MPADLPYSADSTDTNFDHKPLNLVWQSSSLSDLGYVRSVNEDAFLDARENALWVVADGMGGHSFGDRASQIIVEKLAEFTPGGDLHIDIASIEECLVAANQECRDIASGGVMGSTVAALYVGDPYAIFLWAGDSRIYRYRNEQLEQMTTDHSLVQELVTMGEIKRDDMERHPSSHIITRAVGVHDELKLERNYALVEPGDRYLVCSDGLYKDLVAAEIAAGMTEISVDAVTRALVQHALKRGGSDNTTAIVVQAEIED